MKLSDAMLEEGRDYIRDGDLEGLVAWVKKHAPFMNITILRETYGSVFQYQDTEKGLRLFNRVFVGYDPAVDLWRGIFRLTFVVGTVLGVLGGIVYLFRSCVGSP